MTTHDTGALRLVKLERITGKHLGREVREVLPASTRNRWADAQQLAGEELKRTGIKWTVVDS